MCGNAEDFYLLLDYYLTLIKLIKSCALPAEGAVFKITGHSKDSSPEPKGNKAADAAARGQQNKQKELSV